MLSKTASAIANSIALIASLTIFAARSSPTNIGILYLSLISNFANTIIAMQIVNIDKLTAIQ